MEFSGPAVNETKKINNLIIGITGPYGAGCSSLKGEIEAFIKVKLITKPA